ncbi:MAG TPA: glycosyltransferase family 4 protein [Anaerolineae bacterium]|nr:glycosyltransferase family 4 protein [Anaerolineae bacterium]
MMPKVLYSAFDLVPRPKGSTTHIRYFISALTKAGYQLTLITAGDPSLPTEEEWHGARLLRAPALPDQNFLARAESFGQFVTQQAQKETFDLYHVRAIWGGYPLVSQLDNDVPLLYEVNGLPSIEMKYHYPQIRGTAVETKMREREYLTLQAAAGIICPSAVTAHYLSSWGIDPNRITVIPNGVDIQKFAPPAKPATSHKEYPTAVYIGTLAEWQGLENLLRAWALVVADQPAKLRLIGRGRKQQRKALLKLARKLDIADWISLEPALPYEQIPALLTTADLCLAPLSYNDRNVTQGCCPLKILEYMACARPIVASNLPVVRELLIEGQEALLVEPDNPSALATGILTLLNAPDLGRILGQRAANRASRDFTWRRAQMALLATYDTLLDTV